eukprot:CAMPEP_0184856076 /NCGR_PEP_ID=MMETSP0580-20130426/1230_1 /TAXON_ID=1118495 /ORGANISM="Dactyliosolen fragilissimus" /LENGTH=195 /DNA_ID=CAMNT_0027350857 /DNA_START=346 /DNA_END=930 /DNA_ORIENTATION=+
MMHPTEEIVEADDDDNQTNLEDIIPNKFENIDEHKRIVGLSMTENPLLSSPSSPSYGNKDHREERQVTRKMSTAQISMLEVNMRNQMVISDTMTGTNSNSSNLASLPKIIPNTNSSNKNINTSTNNESNEAILNSSFQKPSTSSHMSLLLGESTTQSTIFDTNEIFPSNNEIGKDNSVITLPYRFGTRNAIFSWK